MLVGAGTASAAGSVILKINADSGSNYNVVYMYGDGSAAASSAASNQTSSQVGRFDTVQANFVSSFMDYSATDKHKTVLSRYNASNALSAAWVTRWANTGAVTSFALTPATGTFAAGSTFALYGIAA